MQRHRITGSIFKEEFMDARRIDGPLEDQTSKIDKLTA
jgi:hypothetical protein